MSLLMSICAGICLSAACGFRIFLPFLIMSLAARNGMLDLSGEFAWLASTPALIVLSTATVVEILAFYIPWLDNILDTLATPVAVIAGAMATAAVVTDLPPLAEWLLALVLGGGIAGVVQSGTLALRGTSTATTGGLANPAVATGEVTGAVGASMLGVVLPLVGAILIVGTGLFLFRKIRRLPFFRRRARVT